MIEILGTVIHGRHYGRKLGFPTVNLDRRSYSRRKLQVKAGIWAGTASFQLSANSCKRYVSAIVIEPADSKGLPKIEAHLIGYKGNLYGKKITLVLHKYVRRFKSFPNIRDLKSQIRRDIDIIIKLSRNKF